MYSLNPVLKQLAYTHHALFRKPKKAGCHMTDKADLERLISQSALGNQAAFGHLYDVTASKLYGVCLNILDNHDLAEAALQETFVKVWRSAHSYHVNGLSPMTWLTTIARNIAIDKQRSNQGQHQPHADHEPFEEIGRKPTEINRCLALLESDQAEAIRRAYLKGSTYAYLAQYYDVPINTMRTWLGRSLSKLKGSLSND